MWVELIASALLTASAPQTAPPSTDDDETEVCLLVLNLWRGSASDHAAIASVPVPESFRRQFGWRGCQPLDKPALLEWHLAFGTEQTSATALAWLEQQSLADVPKVGDVARDLKGLVKLAAARPTLAQARLNALADALNRFTFLGDQHLRAAEFYHSPAMLAKAAPYVEAIRIGLHELFDDQIVGTDDEESSIAGLRRQLRLSGYQLGIWRDIDMRFAIEKTRLSRAQNDLEFAETLLALHAETLPTREEATTNAIDHSGDPCADVSSPSELKAACENEGNFGRRLMSYWSYRAQVDDLRDRGAEAFSRWGEEAFFNATQLLQFEQDQNVRSGSSHTIRRRDALVALYISHAKALSRGATLGESTAEDADYRRFAALDLLINAERLASPVTSPGRFRQIASQFRDICQAMTEANRCTRDPLLDRELRYLTQDPSFLYQPKP